MKPDSSISMKKCIVCDSDRFSPIYNQTLLRCLSCGFVTANLTISEKELQKIYTKNYFAGEEYVDYIRDKEILQHNFRKRLETIYRKVGSTDIKRAVEIGCAYGFFGEVLREKLSECEYLGFDIVPEAIDYASRVLKLNVQCESYISTNIEYKATDIFMWDVIEHLPNPETFIKKAANDLIKGGRLYITTGDIGALVPRLQGSKWRMIHPPSHLHYFTKHSLSSLLLKNGLQVDFIGYPAVRRSLHLIYHSLCMLGRPRRRFVESIYSCIPKSLGISMNLRDIMFVIARRK